MTRIIASLMAALARIIAGGNVRWLLEPNSNTQRLYFANHTSNLDFVILWAYLPSSVRRQTRPVAAGDYWRATKIRNYMATRVFHAVLIERKPIEGADMSLGEIAVERMGKVLSEGSSLIIFPEGKRGDGETILPFRSGIYNLWKEYPNIQLVPVRLDNINRILPKGKSMPVPLTSRITFGQPYEPHPGSDRESFLQAAHLALEELDSE